MNKKSYSQILDYVARDQMAADTNLAPRILARIQKGKSATMSPRIKVLVTVCLILLVLIIGLVRVPAVRASIQQWIGYVPGMGLVGEGQIRMLARPISVTRDGITLTVEQVWVDSDRTLIQYSIEGWPWRKLVTLAPKDACLKHAVLRLPNQELEIKQPQATFGWESGYQLKSLYPAIPFTENEIKFVMPCLVLATPGEAPENWELDLHLSPAPSDTVFPVIEISTPVVETPVGTPQEETGSASEGISLVLDRAVLMNDGYLIYATIHYENSGLSGIDFPDPTILKVYDGSGQQVAFDLDWDATNAIQETAKPGQTSFAIKTAPIQAAGPLTLVLDSAYASIAADASLAFDPGPAPMPGQVWELNKEIDLSNGQSLTVLRVTYDLTDGTQAFLRFDMESKTGITYATLFDQAHPLTGAGGGGATYTPGPFSSDLYYLEPLPKGPLTVDIVGISVAIPGHWEAQWTPPPAQEQTDITPQSSACITRESWQQALRTHPTLPASLTGTLALFRPQPASYNYELLVAKLDGSDLKSIGFGSAPSFSPNGTQVVHMGPMLNGPADGLYITDLSSGNSIHLPGTATGDMNPLWSSDGQTIAFTRGPSSGLIGAPGPYNLMVTDLNGSNLRALTEGDAANYAMAWMPNGLRILYTVASQNGASLNLIDIQTGEVTPLFDINYNGTVVVSPDGQWLAFEEMRPLDKYGLFISKLDGSNRKLLADGDPYIVTIPAWSPDGEWVLASVHDPDATQHPNPMLGLIQVDTCKIIPLSNLDGYVSSWIR
jgi:hypothetical protein